MHKQVDRMFCFECFCCAVYEHFAVFMLIVYEHCVVFMMIVGCLCCAAVIATGSEEQRDSAVSCGGSDNGGRDLSEETLGIFPLPSPDIPTHTLDPCKYPQVLAKVYYTHVTHNC